MIWGTEMIWKATAVICAGFLLEGVVRRSSAAIRDAIWTAAFLVLLALPLVSAVAPEWAAPIAMPISVVVTTAGGAAERGVEWAFWIWVSGAAVAFTRLLLSHVQIVRLVRSTRRVDHEHAGVRLCESAEGTMPFTWGLLTPVVVLPQDAGKWPGDLRSAVLEHELAHVKRLDWLRQLSVEVACALFWFHPLVWMAARAAARVRERACDDVVLNSGATTAEYASHLLEVARRVRPLANTAALTYCSELEGRLMAILDSTLSRRSLGAVNVLVIAALAGCFLLPLASVRLLAEDVYRIADGVNPPALIHKVEPDYTPEAKDAKIEGMVKLYVEVTRDGLPENIKVLEGLDAGLDAKAVEAIKQWRFKPGTKDNKPVRVAATVEVHFKLV